jgi:hypothetical protein
MTTDRDRLIARIIYALPLLDNQELLQFATHAECLTTPRPRDTLPAAPPAGCRDTPNLWVFAPEQDE